MPTFLSLFLAWALGFVVSCCVLFRQHGGHVAGVPADALPVRSATVAHVAIANDFAGVCLCVCVCALLLCGLWGCWKGVGGKSER